MGRTVWERDGGGKNSVGGDGERNTQGKGVRRQ